jgi:hypothetical protein
MYYFLDDIIEKDWFESEQPIPLDLGLHWHQDKRPREIQATAELIQATCTDETRNPICERVKTLNKPDFSGLLEENKAREYQLIELDLDIYAKWGERFAPRLIVGILLTCDSSTRPIGAHSFVPAIVCKQRAIASEKYDNFPDIDKLRQILINRFYQRKPL